MEPFTMMLLGGLGGGLLNSIFGGGGYDQIGSAADVTNINPFTGRSWDILSQAYGGAMNTLGQYDYTQPFSYFTSQLAPELQGLSTSGEYAQGQLGLAKSQANQIRSQLAQQYSGNNALFSGAFGEALGAGVSQPYMQAIANITGQQSNLLGGLYGGALSTLPGLYQQPYNIAGNLASQALSGIGQYGMPTFYEPSYGYVNSPFSNFLSGFGSGAGIGGAFGSIPGMGGGGGGGSLPSSSSYYYSGYGW